MGSTLSSTGAEINETPEHEVTLSKDFYIKESYEVTQGQWEAIMGGANSWPASAPESPSTTYGYSSLHPAYFISWHDITKEDGFLDKVKSSLGL